MVNRGCATPSGDIIEFLNYIWQQWSIQAIVVGSLAFQIVLIFAAPSRIRAKSSSCIFTLWSVYLLADYIATFGIALINNDSKIQTISDESSSSSSSSCGAVKDDSAIAALWAPFLLLHLGGPDTITAFAVEDNELWTRHLVTLIAQLLSVLLVFYRYHILENDRFRFLIPTALIFIAGVIKCGERTRSLNLASQDSLKKSMRVAPDAGPDYPQLMEEMASKQAANLPVIIDLNREKGAKADTGEDGGIIRLEEIEVVKHAYKFFEIFKGLIVDHMFSFLERQESRAFYTSLEYKDAFRVVEMELNFIYDAMFTKMIAIQCISGYILRFISTALLIAATLIFSRQSHHHIHLVDIIVTYFLLAGGVALDLIAIVDLLFSKWTIASLLVGSENSFSPIFLRNLQKTAATMISKVKGCIIGRSKRRWSEKMNQYSFINHTLHKEKWPNWVSYIIDKFGLNEVVCSCLYAKTRDVEEEMKKLIFDEIKKKGKQATKTSVAKEISSSKGEWTLLDYTNVEPDIHFSVSPEVEYDECVLMWHIATEIFYFSSSRTKTSSDGVHDADICRYISEYLLYLLVMERKMITVDIKFRDTFEEARKFFNRERQQQKTPAGCFKNVKKACGLYLKSMMLSTWDDIKYVFTLKCFTEKGRKRKPTRWEEHQNMLEDDERKAVCDWLKTVRPQLTPSEVKGDRSRSLLFHACALAGHLESLCVKNTPYIENQVWEMMSKVWVELLSYGACHCRGDANAQSLAKGGELRTFVWLLMAHFGLGEQFRNDPGPARVKLIVGKE